MHVVKYVAMNRSGFHDSLVSSQWNQPELINDVDDIVDRAKQTVRRSLRRKRPSSLKSRLAAAPSLPPIPASDAVELVSETQDRPLEQRRRPSFKHSNSDLSLRPTTLDTTGNGRQKPHLQGGFR